MVEILCKIVGDGDVFPVSVDEAKFTQDFWVNDLKELITGENKDITVPLWEVHLYMAKKKDGGWLDGAGAAKVMFDEHGHPQGFEEMDPTLYLKNDKLFGASFKPGEDQVHVLVVVPELSTVNRHTAQDEDLPPAKRVKLAPVQVAFQGPVFKECYSVPMETIDTYQKLQAAFLSRKIASLCLLYGPRQFGKTTIAYRLWNLLAAHPSVLVIYCSLTPSTVKTEEDFWLALSKFIGEETRSSKEFEDMFQRRKKRLWLAIDEMDIMFKNEELTSNFMHCLREWQSSQYVLGFLGIGSHDLLNMPLKLKRGKFGSPFNLCEVFQVKPFSTDQMSDFSKQIKGRHPFRDSTRQGIMEYSAGAPGVFGSLVRYSTDFDKCNQERHEWDHWFKIQSFSNYLDTHNWAYRKIREDLQKLSQSDWELLSLLLKDDVSGSSAEFRTNRENSLRLGVVMTGVCDASKLEFSSAMMRRLCLEALPIRDIKYM